jgi:hypothetical protein
MSHLVFLESTMNPFWDKNILVLIEGIKNSLPDQQLTTIAKEIAAIFALIYLSVKAYTMIIGEGKFEVMPLFRPFIITVIITNFSLFTSMVGYPGTASGAIGKANFEANANIMDQDMNTKDRLTDELFKTLIENTTQLKDYYVQSSKVEQAVGDQIADAAINMLSLGTSEAMTELNAYLTVYEQLLWIKLSLWMQGFITWIVLGIFKGVCYCLFFLQLILLYVLGCLGPISFAFSIAGPFKESWVQWVSRYIAVSFYSTIGFIILNIACAIMSYGINQEVDRLSQLLAKKDAVAEFIASVEHIDNFIGYLFIAMVTAIAGIVSTPVVSSWIIGSVSTGTAFFNTFVSTASRGVSKGQAVAGQVATASRNIISN